MNVLADPVVDALLVEFQQAVTQLQLSGTNPSVSKSSRVQVVRQLCELSRDIRFHLGPPRHADSDQLTAIANAFKDAGVVIESVFVNDMGSVADYRDNILKRGTQCRM